MTLHPPSSESAVSAASTANGRGPDPVPPPVSGSKWSAGTSALWTAAGFLWSYLVGVVLCQTLVTSVLVIGWTYRYVQRCVLKDWWKRSCRLNRDNREVLKSSFREFAAGDYRTLPHTTRPNWIAEQGLWARILKEERAHRRIMRFLLGGCRSAWANLKTGVQGIFNTWVFTLPGCVLFLFAWYDGWNNSFNKGYEQAAVGPLTGVLGMALFIAAMAYVPIAQVRQAVTGEWRSFYQFRFVWTVIQQRWLASVVLAGLYALAQLPVVIFKGLPGFFPHINPALAEVPPEEALQILVRFYFWTGLVLFPLYVGLRLVAGRIYAKGVLEALRRGKISEEMLSDLEWETLHRLGLLDAVPSPYGSVVGRVVRWFGSRAGRVVAGFLIVLIWFSFLAQNIVTEFLNYHPKTGWLNHPLVQLPSIRHIPPALRAGEPVD